MKKVSTVTAKSSRNFSQQKLTIGLDLGDRNSWYVLDEAGHVQQEQRVRTTEKGLREVFEAMPHSRIALEIGTHSAWISRLLSELGHEVIVANARNVRLIGESRKKDDQDGHPSTSSIQLLTSRAVEGILGSGDCVVASCLCCAPSGSSTQIVRLADTIGPFKYHCCP